MNQKPGLKCVGGTALVDKPADVSSVANKDATLPALLQKVRKVALENLHQMTGVMFDKADDLFFEYASKAGDSMSQNACLDAMRMLRLKRKEFEKTFFTKLAEDFKALASPNRGVIPSLESISSLDGLSVMDKNEMEEIVATESMVNKAREAFSTPLYQLHTRLDALMLHTTIDKSNNPIDPLQICSAFKAAIQIVDCDIKYRLIFFKLFQRHVLDGLDSVIDNCNFHLAEAGVLPELKGTPTQIRNTTSSHRTACKGEIGSTETSQASQAPVAPNTQAMAPSATMPVGSGGANELFAQMQTLLASVRAISGSGAMAAGSIGSVSAQASEVASADLMGMLSGMQQALPSGEADICGDHTSQLNIHNTLNNVLKQQESQAGPQRVGQSDSDVISLVSMLFDFILDDDNLPVRVKAVIGRLQIPFLKVAINDKSFLNSSAHPARKLLNELARAGIGLNDLTDQIKNDLVFKRVTDTVQKVLNEFSEDVSIFNGILDEFTGFMRHENRRSDMIEQRTKAAEEGRVLAEDGKNKVALALHEKVDGKFLPTVVAKIIDGPWSNYLFLVYLKQGVDSKPWQMGLQTVDQLIASVSPPENEAEKRVLFNTAPVLLKNLRAGFNTISLNPFEMSELLNGLEKIQMEVMRGDKPDYIADIEDKKEPTDRLLDAVAKNMACDVEPSAEDAEEKKLSPIVQHTERVAKLEIKRKISEPEKVELPALQDEDEHLSLVKRLQVGAWLELQMDDQKVRCKLAAHIKSVDKMIFVNRTGMKVLEKTMLEIAYDLKSGKLTLLDDSLLFDRALESVISNLKSIREKA